MAFAARVDGKWACATGLPDRIGFDWVVQ